MGRMIEEMEAKMRNQLQVSACMGRWEAFLSKETGSLLWQDERHCGLPAIRGEPGARPSGKGLAERAHGAVAQVECSYEARRAHGV